MTDKLDTSAKQVRKFGLLFAAVSAGVAGFVAYARNPAWGWYGACAIFFLLGALFLVRVLRPLYVAWMKFAFVLGWINARLLLGLFFFLILTPIGLVMRVMGKDLLDLKRDLSAKSYWIKREQVPFDPARYERMF